MAELAGGITLAQLTVSGGLASVLVWSIYEHAHDLTGLQDAIELHGVLSPAKVRWSSAIVLFGECVVATGLLGGAVAWDGLRGWSFTLAASLFGMFAGYLIETNRRRAGEVPVPCGCGVFDRAITQWSFLVPLSLALVAAAAALVAAHDPIPVAERLVIVAVAFVVATAAIAMSRFWALAIGHARYIERANELTWIEE